MSGGPAGYTGPFTIGYNCGVGHVGTESVSAGSFKDDHRHPRCDGVHGERVASRRAGGLFVRDADVQRQLGDPERRDSHDHANGETVEVTTVNTLSRDTGSLTLSKVLTGGPAGYTGPFTINYDCNDGTAHDGSKSVAAGTTSSVIAGIPTGTQCTISETLPAAPAGYSFGTPSFSPSSTVTIVGERSDRQRADDQHLTSTAPPVTPPSPKADITVTKAATPAVQLPVGGGSVPITYSIVVSNAGPDAAPECQGRGRRPGLGDIRLWPTTSAGTCTTTALALDCTISSIPAGGSVSITINATVSSTGTKDERRHHDDDDPGDEPEQQHRSGPDGRHRDRGTADAEAEAEAKAGADDLQHGHCDPEGSERPTASRRRSASR